ncbi:LSU ribosomal protein L4p (L1e) [Candidatus Vidania fulgoroideae]|nr:LSU ribosomal protein L4p (L1e) [Candidatus Vidania fulgoroideae]
MISNIIRKNKNKSINKLLLRQILNCMYFNGKRKCGFQKTRGEKKYSKKKMSPQKGTGKARLGSRSSPVLTGGGRAFPGRAVNKKKKINKKMYKKCMYQCFLYSQKKFKNLIFVPEKKNTKTKEFVKELIRKKIYGKKNLFIFKKKDMSESKLVRNIKNIEIDQFERISVLKFFKSDYNIFYNFSPYDEKNKVYFS